MFSTEAGVGSGEAPAAGGRDGRRVCLLTGASGRLGTAFCRLFASRYDIAAVHRTRPPELASQDLVLVDPLDPGADLEENRHPVFAIQADLAVDAEIARVVELTLARFGRIDLLVNAAVHSVWAPMVTSSVLVESLDRQLRLNVAVPVRLSVEVARRFWRDRADENRRARRGVVNVSSIAGSAVYPGHGQSVYSATKAALTMLTYHMADEFAQFGVRANCLAPNSFPRLVATEDAAAALARLDAGSGTGRVLVLDGGEERWLQPQL